MDLVVILVVVLAVIAVAQMMRVYELSNNLRGRREEDIPYRFNQLNGLFMLIFMFIFYGGFIWLLAEYGAGGLGPAASKHGADMDWLFNINYLLILAIFFLTNTLLFVFAFKYYKRPGKKAYFFPHNNKLELIWTVIPAIVLAIIIILGLNTWNSITAAPSDDAKIVEVYSKQFSWTARYSGENNLLGNADYKLISSKNPLGLISSKTVGKRVKEIEENIQKAKDKLENDTLVMSKVKEMELKTKISRLTNISRRTKALYRRNKTMMDSLDMMVMDDKVTNTGLHFKKGQEYLLVFRAQDVIHSAYFPHFRMQMNTVPGMRTTFSFTPTITTDSMRNIMGNPDFDYVLMCNKVCGLSHSNMQMKVVVDNEEDYEKWMKERKTFAQKLNPEKEGEQKNKEGQTEEKSTDSSEENNSNASANEEKNMSDSTQNTGSESN